MYIKRARAFHLIQLFILAIVSSVSYGMWPNGPLYKNWRDDSAFANCHVDIKGIGSNTVIFNIQGFGQVFMPLPTLKPGVQHITFEAKYSGQIESGTGYLRKISRPWTGYGGSSFIKSIAYKKWTKIHIQTRTTKKLKGNVNALFCGFNGTGKVYVRNLNIKTTDKFDIPSPPADIKDKPVIPNGNLKLGLAGWVKLGNLSYTADNGTGAVKSPGGMLLLESIRLYNNIKYQLVITGTGIGRGEIRLTNPTQRNRIFYKRNFKLRDGKWTDDIELKLPESGGLKLENYFNVYLYLNNPLKITSIKLNPEGFNSQIQEAGFDINFSNKKNTSVLLGETLKIKLSTTCIEAGTCCDVKIFDCNNKTVAVIPVKVEKLENGLYGSTFKYTTTKYGWFNLKLYCGKKEIASPPEEFTVESDKKIDTSVSDFVLGAHFTWWTWRNGQGYILTPKSSELLEKAYRMGIRSLRTHPPGLTKWDYLEKEKGKWSWQHSDPVIKASLKSGIAVLGMFDRSAKYATSAPQNMMKRNGHDGWGAYPPENIEDWRRYVRTVANHYKGKITSWEIWNEPDHSFFKLNPQKHKSKDVEYVKLVKAAYEEVKKIDPNIKIISGAVTAGGKGFLIKCIERGMLKYCDGISFHGYGRIAGTGAMGAESYMDMVRTIRQACRKAGVKREIWDSESGMGGICDGITGKAKSETAVKGVISIRAAGLSHYYIYNGFLKDYPGHGDHRMLLGYAGRPLVIQPLLTAYNNVLGDTKFKANIGRDKAGLHVYVFEKSDGSSVIAAWAKKKIKVRQKALKAGNVLDEMGNITGKFENGTIQLSESIQYFSD